MEPTGAPSQATGLCRTPLARPLATNAAAEAPSMGRRTPVPQECPPRRVVHGRDARLGRKHAAARPRHGPQIERHPHRRRAFLRERPDRSRRSPRPSRRAEDDLGRRLVERLEPERVDQTGDGRAASQPSQAQQRAAEHIGRCRRRECELDRPLRRASEIDTVLFNRVVARSSVWRADTRVMITRVP